jgi:hypothetical protein
MLMPYRQNDRGNCISIVINALRAKEKTKFKQFLKHLALFNTNILSDGMVLRLNLYKSLVK